MYHILNGLAKNIAGGKVNSVQLIKVRPGTEGWARLAKGVKEALTLQVLKINHCNLGQPALEALCTGLRSNASLKALDLSYNHMSDKLGGIVARLVKDQGEFRDSQLWVGSLRSHPDSRTRSSSRKRKDDGQTEQERAAKLEGLVEFILHHNCFGEKFMTALAPILQTDRYVRKIDLRYNQVMEADI